MNDLNLNFDIRDLYLLKYLDIVKEFKNLKKNNNF